jgi:hypothetical protein
MACDRGGDLGSLYIHDRSSGKQTGTAFLRMIIWERRIRIMEDQDSKYIKGDDIK